MVLLNLLIKYYFLHCLCWNVILVSQKKFGFYLKLFPITLGTCIFQVLKKWRVLRTWENVLICFLYNKHMSCWK